MVRWALGIVVCSVVGCSDDPQGEPFRYTVVVTELVARDDTGAGLVLAQLEVEPDTSSLEVINRSFTLVAACPRAATPLLVDASGTLVGPSGRGQLRMFLAQDADGGTTDHCAGEGRFLVQPDSLDDGGEALVRAPLVIEGPTLVSRLDMSAILGIRDLPFDDLVELSARVEGDPTRLSDGQLRPSWSASGLHARLTGAGLTYLDAFVYYGGQPDVDRDGDGLEELFDDDGDGLVDRCRDADGTDVAGRDCPSDPRFADAFGLAIDYRTDPAAIVGIADP